MSPSNEEYIIQLIKEQQLEQKELNKRLEEVTNKLTAITTASQPCRDTVYKHERILSGNGSAGIVTRLFETERLTVQNNTSIEKIEKTLQSWRRLTFTTLTTAIFTMVSAAVSLILFIF